MIPTEALPEARVPITTDRQIVEARQQGRALATSLGFDSCEATLIATAISELARNILLYARQGELVVRALEREGRRGIVLIARDDGPGIEDVPRALLDGHSTSGRLGLGLPGVRRLMDEFHITSQPGLGTLVEARKWIT